MTKVSDTTHTDLYNTADAGRKENQHTGLFIPQVQENDERADTTPYH